MNVPRYDYAAQFGEDLDDVTERIRAILARGEYDCGPEAQAFENAFAAFLGIAHARAVGCGTDALTLTLEALDIGPGDEVITQANTFYATVASIVLAGATPVLVDVDEETFLIDPAAVEAAVTTRTRAIMPVHLYGKPSPMSELIAIATRYSLAIVEDAAQAHGARYRGRRVGTFGVAGCFSFHPSKNLAAAGDAGCVVTESAALALRIEAFRRHGQAVLHQHDCLGINSKMDALQAVVLASKLPKLDRWNAQRRAIAHRYRSALSDLQVSFQREDPEDEHVYHLFQVRTPQRDDLLECLRQAGVDAIVRYPLPAHLQPAFARFSWRPGQFPRSERLARELLCLPVRPDLTLEEQTYVVDLVREFYAAVPA